MRDSQKKINKPVGPKAQAPPPQAPSTNNSIFSNIGSTIANGFSFGLGSAIAHNGINDIFNKSEEKEKEIKSTIKITDCDKLVKDYISCMDQNEDNCDNIIKLYDKCTRSII